MDIVDNVPCGITLGHGERCINGHLCGSCSRAIRTSNEIQSLHQQLALKDLEVMQLRESFKELAFIVENRQSPSCQKGVIDKCRCTTCVIERGRATTFTPAHLIAWLGEPVAWQYEIPTEFDGWVRTELSRQQLNVQDGTKIITLYAPKLDMKG